MQCRIIDEPHRHVTFTIPEELRPFFRLNREVLNDLFTAVSKTIYFIANYHLVPDAYEPGFITVLHTFGRDLKWNPHCHVLLCSKIFTQTYHPSSKDFFLPYKLLRVTFQKCLLDCLKQRYGKIFNKLVSLIYKAHTNGFYVHAPAQNVNTQSVIKYIGRYLGRPPIASSRIDSYDGQSVTFHYTRHEDSKTVSETVSALDFIKKLIVHIPNKHFKMVRYFGFYSSEGILRFRNLRPKVSPDRRRLLRDKNKWRTAMIQAFQKDPLKCSVCGETMEPIYLTTRTYTYYYPGTNTKRAMEIQCRFLLRQNRSSA